MRLADFILSNREPILREWEAFARTCAPASGTMDVERLRDHADEMLTVIAADLATPQDRFAQSEKSKGRAEADDPAATTAAEEHGVGRAESGFTVEQMVAEYRALRASVIRLWTESEGQLAAEHIDDLTRFNEAIDQSLAESVSQFNRTVEHAKEMFLAILGHDLRTPLGAISVSAEVLLQVHDLEEARRTRIASAIANSAARTTQMVGDLLDFTRSRLGGGIPVVRAKMSMGNLVHEVVEEISTAHPRCPIEIAEKQPVLSTSDVPVRIPGSPMPRFSNSHAPPRFAACHAEKDPASGDHQDESYSFIMAIMKA